MNSTHIKTSRGRKVFLVCNAIFMIIFTIIMLFPFLNVLALSFNDGADAVKGGIFLWPRVFTLSNYQFVFSNSDLIRGFFNSVLRVLVGTVTAVLCNALLGYIVSCRRFYGRKFMRMLFLITMYFGGGLIPTYLLMVRLGFMNTFWVYIIPSLFSAYYMLLTSSYIQGLPEALFESARIDGAGEITIFGKIVLPLSTPMLACIALYAGVGHWNSWFDVSLYSKNGTWDNLQIILYRLINQANALEKLMESQTSDVALRNIRPETMRAATTVVVVLPIVMVYPFLQKYFVSGITLGAVKG